MPKRNREENTSPGSFPRKHISRFVPTENAPGEDMCSQGEPAKPPPTPIPKIREIVFTALAEAEGASDSQDAFKQRVERVANANPGFAEAYPKLLEVACSATSREKAASIRQFLPLMLAQMSEIDANKSTFEDASKVVGVALGNKWAPPPTKQ